MQTKPSQLTETVSRPTGIKMALLLFWEFIKLGAFTFGSGWSIIAQMEQEFVDKRHWVEQSDLLELIAVGKSLPGIMVANIVLLFGYQLAGPLGGILSAVGLCVPAVIVMTVVTAIYDLIKNNYWVFAALKGVQCAVVPIIGSAAISLGKEALKDKIAIGLFLAFAKIGFTSFGGTSMIPLIMEEMLSHNWMTADDVANIVAIAEMTPGSLGVNCATFAGTQTAGVLGGTAAVMGVLTPTLTLTLVAALFFQKFRESKVMLYIMRAVKPICVGMIFAVLITLSGSTYFAEGISWAGLGIGLLCFWLLRKKKMAIPKVIGIAAVLGLVCFGVL